MDANTDADDGRQSMTTISIAQTLPPLPQSLYDFIRRDIIRGEGNNILMPFLTTNDLLRLSECSKQLLDYRYQLSRVGIVLHPSPTFLMKRALFQLMAKQVLGVEDLQIRDSAVLKLLGQGGWHPCCSRVKTLDLSGVTFDEQAVMGLEQALLGGNLLDLEELYFAKIDLVPSFGPVTDCLAQGACPALCHLSFSNTWLSSQMGEALGTTISLNHCKNLRCLELNDCDGDPEFFIPIATALQDGCGRMLQQLLMANTNLSGQGIRALGIAMEAGALPLLEVLKLSVDDSAGDDDVVHLMMALELGQCPQLRELACGSDLGPAGVEAFARALASGNCGRLQVLKLYIVLVDASLMPVLDAIKEGACPDLRQFDLNNTGIDEESYRALGETIQAGALSKLRGLRLMCNDGVSDELPALDDPAFHYIIKALQSRKCPDLVELDLSGIGVGPLSAQAVLMLAQPPVPGV